MLKFLTRRGDPNEREVQRLLPTVARINELEPQFTPLTDAELRGKTDLLRARLHDAVGDLLIPIEQRAAQEDDEEGSELAVSDPNRLSEERRAQRKQER